MCTSGSNNKGGSKEDVPVSWDEIYADLSWSDFFGPGDVPTFFTRFEARRLDPFHLGGHPKGYVHGRAFQLLAEMIAKGAPAKDGLILDVGSGLGDFTVYLALKNPARKVIGLDVSREAKNYGEKLAERFGAKNTSFLMEGIENTSLPDESVDFIVGFGSFHHFIGETGASAEVRRILKRDGRGIFVDPCHENYAYRLFHNKKLMKELGDHLMTRRKIRAFWGSAFEIEVIPTDWAVMIDKLVIYFRKRLLKTEKVLPIQVSLSGALFRMDRRIERLPRAFTTWFTGSIITVVKRKN